MKAIWFCFLYITAGIDLWKREIPVWIFMAFGVAGTAGVILAFLRLGIDFRWSHLAGIGGSMAIGMALLFLSHVTKGALGEGDACFFLVSGLYISWKMNLALFCYSLMLGSLYAIGVLLWGCRRGQSAKGKKMPFLPFVWLTGVFLL